MLSVLSLRLLAEPSVCACYGEDSARKKKKKIDEGGGGVKATPPGKSHKMAENVPI